MILKPCPYCGSKELELVDKNSKFMLNMHEGSDVMRILTTTTVACLDCGYLMSFFKKDKQ